MNNFSGDTFIEEARSSIAMSIVSTMEVLNDTTYESWTTWKLKFELALNLLGFELALDRWGTSPEEKLKHEAWKRGNRIGLMLMKSKMSNSIFSYLELKKRRLSFYFFSVETPAKLTEMLDDLEKMVMDNERIKAPTTLKKLVGMRYNGRSNVREHLMEMVSIATKLRAVGSSLPDSKLKEYMLDSFPPMFDPVRLYCTQSPEGGEVHEIVKRCWNIEATANLCK